MAKSKSAAEHPSGGHVPVLLDEVMSVLAPLAGRKVLDGTFGGGGYSAAFLKAGAKVCGIDRDPVAAQFAARLAAQYPQSFQFVAGTFSELDRLCGTVADAVVLDIGVSSMQLETAARGFSFMRDGPLDMRMGGEGPSAADLVNKLPERDLADLLYGLGEEKRSRAVAKAIVAARKQAPITTTLALARLIAGVVHGKPGDIHPATRSFQALRIAVNAEFTELVEGLFAAERLLHEGGILSVVTFHSLEDRIVKRFFRPDVSASRHRPAKAEMPSAWSEVKKPVKAGEAELAGNPRARSATLRSGRRSAAPARPVAYAGLGVPEVALRDLVR
ncbi:MAG: 16S rRNA (cytosine(1402)-N(4))-methyltransferase RsmH [Cucumibacter sp.]